MSSAGPSSQDALLLAVALLTRRADDKIPDDDPVLLTMLGLGSDEGALLTPMAAAGLMEVGMLLLDRIVAAECRTRDEILREVGLSIAACGR